MILLGLIGLAPFAVTAACPKTPVSDDLRVVLTQLARDERIDGGARKPGDADLLRDFFRLEPTLSVWTFVEVAHRLPDDDCTRRLLGPILERRVRACVGGACSRDHVELLESLVFRRDVRAAVDRDEAAVKGDAGAFWLEFGGSIRGEPGADGGLRIRVVSPADDGGVRVLAENSRDDPAAEVLLEHGPVQLFIDQGDTPTTFGRAHGRTWMSGEALAPGSALVACTDGALKPLGRLRGTRAIWQFFPEQWTRQFEYQLPCTAAFVVPATGGIRPGSWRAFPLGDARTSPEDTDPGPRYVDGTRVRRFGPVTYRETSSDPTHASIDDKRCLIEATVNGTKRSTALSSSYGCQLDFAADFNADGLADVVVHMGHESCEHDFLYLSGPDGWTSVASEGSCE